MFATLLLDLLFVRGMIDWFWLRRFELKQSCIYIFLRCFIINNETKKKGGGRIRKIIWSIVNEWNKWNGLCSLAHLSPSSRALETCAKTTVFFSNCSAHWGGILRNVNDSKKSATRSFWGISAKKCSLLNYIRVIGANKKQLRSKNWGHSLRWNIEY